MYSVVHARPGRTQAVTPPIRCERRCWVRAPLPLVALRAQCGLRPPKGSFSPPGRPTLSAAARAVESCISITSCGKGLGSRVSGLGSNEKRGRRRKASPPFQVLLAWPDWREVRVSARTSGFAVWILRVVRIGIGVSSGLVVAWQERRSSGWQDHGHAIVSIVGVSVDDAIADDRAQESRRILFRQRYTSCGKCASRNHRRDQ